MYVLLLISSNALIHVFKIDNHYGQVDRARLNYVFTLSGWISYKS